MFLRNAWYVAAWDRELGQVPLAVRVLGEDIVLYRRSDGRAVALEDACPHRKLPLSQGRIQGDLLECGYHGLRFDCSGRCVKVPGTDNIPAAALVRAFPLENRYGLLWIWMGEPAGAARQAIHHIPHWDDPTWGRNQGEAMTMACNYLHITDNLLDPSHVSWVHQSSFGNADYQETEVDTLVAENGITVSRWMHDLTPIDASNTRYYWFQMRNFAPGDAEVSRQFTESVGFAFAEDKKILEAVQKGIDKARVAPIGLKIDLGPTRFRRALAQLIAKEQAELAAVAHNGNAPGMRP